MGGGGGGGGGGGVVCNISGGHQPISVHLSGMATQINTWAVIVS